MNLLLNKAGRIWASVPEKLKFLLVGGYNTAFGYGLFCGLQYFLGAHLHYLIILILVHIISVFNSFISLRFLVFLSKGHFWQEYVRVNIVYLGYLLLNILLLYLLKDLFKINLFVAQLICIVSLVCLTYVAHKKFSFKK